MPKVIDFLEKYVQWIALAIGVLFLGYMGYAHFVEMPLGAQVVSGEKLPPGEVDKAVEQKALLVLQNKMKDPTPLPAKPIDPVRDFVASVDKPVVPPNTAIVGQPQPPTSKPGIAGGGVTPTTLPTLAAPTFTAAATGRSTVSWSEPSDTTATATATATAAAAARSAAATPVATPVDQRDTDWWSGAFRVDMASLNAALAPVYEQAELPPGSDQRLTRFLRVWVERQELLPDGKTFSSPSRVEPLRNVVLQDYPQAQDPKELKYPYLDWAGKNVPLILAPPFVDTVPGKGEPWRSPGTPAIAAAPAAGAAVRPFDGVGDPRIPPERTYVPGGLPSASPPPGAYVPGGVPLPGLPPDPYNPGGLPPGYLPSATPLPSTPGAARPPVGAGVATIFPGMGANETEGFDPANHVGASFDIIAHDISLEPGKTYRYRLRYAIRNPFWDRNHLAQGEALTRFDLVSPFSEWSPPVEVQSRIKFWLADLKAAGGRREAQVDLFVFENGGWRKQQVSVAPGESIADTQWALVDVRDPKRAGDKGYAVLADPSGNAVRRSPRGDAADAEYNDLKNQTAPPAPPAPPAAAAAAPGTPPGAVPAGVPLIPGSDVRPPPY